MSSHSQQARQLVLNQIQTPDGTVLTSRFRHDYQSHLDENGETYVVDGGTSYAMRSVNNIPAKELSVYADECHTKVRCVLTWGTYGINGDEPCKFLTLNEMTTPHIEAVIKNVKRLDPWRKQIMENELAYRKHSLHFGN